MKHMSPRVSASDDHHVLPRFCRLDLVPTLPGMIGAHLAAHDRVSPCALDVLGDRRPGITCPPT